MSIKDIGGRFRSERTEAEYAQLLKKELDALEPDERDIALAAIQDLMVADKSPILEAASFDLYWMAPADMKTFLTDPHYLGAAAKSLYPTVKEDLIEIFEGGYQEAILGGSLSGGKSTALVIACVRMLYELSCLRNPHEVYGVMPSDMISIPCLSVTEDAAERNLVSKVRSIVQDSPYFQRHFKPLKLGIGTGLIFPNKIIVPPGASQASQILGANSIGMILDEGNFFHKRDQSNARGEIKENVDIIYEAVRRRIESRFMKRGRLPGIIMVASSKTTPTAFTERLIAKNVDNPKVFVRERSVWESKPDDLSGENFRVAAGNDSKMSRILAEGDPDPEGQTVLEVPVEYRSAFENDIDAALRDFGGVSTIAVTPFLARREKIYQCIDKTREHPFSLEVWDQDMPGKIHWDAITEKGHDGALRPKFYHSHPRFAHVDLSKTQDCTGIAIGCLAGYKEVQRFGSAPEMAPIIHIDFMLRVQPPMAGEIDYAALRKLIYDFSQNGFYIKQVSADQFQSAGFLQSVKSQGYLTKLVSIEAPGGPYETLKTAIYEERFQMYKYGPVIKELRELQKDWKTGKVDHPAVAQGGKKDVADALAAITSVITEYAAKGIIMDQPVRNFVEVITNRDEDDWVLDGQIAISEESVEGPEWRKNAATQQSELRKNMETQAKDWKTNFEMPFLSG